MSNLNLVTILEAHNIPLDNIVAIRHAFNKKTTKKIWDRNDRKPFELYQSMQPNYDFFYNKQYVLSFIADGNNHARFVGCYEILNSYPITESRNVSDFEKYEWYNPADIFFEMRLTSLMLDLIDRLVIDWPNPAGYVQYKKEALAKKDVVSISPDSKHIFPGYNRVIWDFSTMKEYVTSPTGEYEEIENALKEVFAVYLVVDKTSGRYYVGSAYGKDGLYGRWKTYATTRGKGGGTEDDDCGNKGVVEYLKENPNAYLNFQYSILEIIHKTGIKEKDIDATLEAEKTWKQKLCTYKTDWGLNCN